MKQKWNQWNIFFIFVVLCAVFHKFKYKLEWIRSTVTGQYVGCTCVNTYQLLGFFYTQHHSYLHRLVPKKKPPVGSSSSWAAFKTPWVLLLKNVHHFMTTEPTDASGRMKPLSQNSDLFISSGNFSGRAGAASQLLRDDVITAQTNQLRGIFPAPCCTVAALKAEAFGKPAASEVFLLKWPVCEHQRRPERWEEILQGVRHEGDQLTPVDEEDVSGELKDVRTTAQKNHPPK